MEAHISANNWIDLQDSGNTFQRKSAIPGLAVALEIARTKETWVAFHLGQDIG
jgi:hypothetical protein